VVAKRAGSIGGKMPKPRRVVKVVIGRSLDYYGAWEIFLHWNTGHVEVVGRSHFGPDMLRAQADALATKHGRCCYYVEGEVAVK
jgi:hypothetical protein